MVGEAAAALGSATAALLNVSLFSLGEMPCLQIQNSQR